MRASLAWHVTFTLAALYALLFGGLAHAETSRAWRTTRSQGELLARIAINENTNPLRSDDSEALDFGEVDLIASVVFNNRGKIRGRSWTDIMRALAPHVGLLRPYTQHQQSWTSNLRGCSTDEPGGWDETRNGPWKNYSSKWKVFCEAVRDRWVNVEYRHDPYVVTWGSLSDAKKLLCAPGKRKRAICLMYSVPGGNLFFGRQGSAPCNPVREQEFVQEYCSCCTSLRSCNRVDAPIVERTFDTSTQGLVRLQSTPVVSYPGPQQRP